MNVAPTYFTPEYLIIEHFQGQCRGMLNAALEFLQSCRATLGLCSEEEIAEAAADMGFPEDEIAAALLIESGEFTVLSDAEAAGLWIK